MVADWRFCPQCGARIERSERRAECGACGFVHYDASAPTASAVLVDDAGRVLLARRAFEPEHGKWDLPGGFLEAGEHPLDGLRRELHEETGLAVEPVELLGIWMDVYGNAGAATLNLYWLCRADGEPSAADDIDEVRWFSADALPPPEELAFRANALVLDAWRQQHAQRAR
jgi:ADP-ribose pyrophosphatase YjhB (NUDIX family)